MKGKPIEPGCLALIVQAKSCKENIGRVVRVLRKPEPLESIPGSVPKKKPWRADTWLVEALPGHPDLVRSIVNKDSRILLKKATGRHLGVMQKNLIRIDDDDESLDRVVEQSKPVIKTKPVEEIF